MSQWIVKAGKSLRPWQKNVGYWRLVANKAIGAAGAGIQFTADKLLSIGGKTARSG
jgi:hypothetical protein